MCEREGGTASSLKLGFHMVYYVFMCQSPLFTGVLYIFFSFNISVNFKISLILQMRKPSHRVVKRLFHGNPASEQSRQG